MIIISGLSHMQFFRFSLSTGFGGMKSIGPGGRKRFILGGILWNLGGLMGIC